MADFNHLLEDLVLANHILHYNHVVDAFGHISIRHPTNLSRFIMSANTAPALVRSPADFADYNVDDAQPAARRGDGSQKGFVERYIHSELYKRYAGVVCVIHAHADDVLPYTVSGVPFRAMAQTAGFVGYQGAHTWDVERYYERGDAHDLLIKNTRLGAAFASFFSWAGHRAELPEQTVVLMRRHGFTTWGRSLKEAVYRAVYATKNAKLQTTATLLRGAFDADPKNAKPGWSDGVAKGPIHAFESLTEEQAQDTEVANSRAVERPWGLWVQEVRCQALYTSSVYTG